MDKFTAAYILCALWSSTGDDDVPLDRDHDATDIAPEALAKMEADCAAFQAAHGEHIGGQEEQAGHDFWLTRNGHGCGFCDGDWPEPAAAVFYEASKAAGECNLYVGDDGQIYML